MTTIVMTGTPTGSLSKEKLAKIALIQGFHTDSSVTAQRTDILVYNPATPDTTKIRRAEDLNARGLASIGIMTYAQFYSMLEDKRRYDNARARALRTSVHA